MTTKFLLTLSIIILFTACARPNRENNFGGENSPREAVVFTPPVNTARTGADSAAAELLPAPASPASPPAPSAPVLRAPPPGPSPESARPEASPVLVGETTAPVFFGTSEQPPAVTEDENEPIALDLADPEIAAAPEQAPLAPRSAAPSAEPRAKAPPANAPKQTQRSEVSGLERQLLALINKSRAAGGLPPLAFSRAQSKGTAACMGSAGHSEFMAQRQSLSHANFPRNICFRSGASAENVGYASGEESRALRTVHKSMMDEGPGGGHYDNIMNRNYNTVGLGFFYYKGVLWVTESFLRL